jgi:hypothetical protein
MLAPTMPKATIYHGDLRSARKKVSFVAFLLVQRLTPNSIRKYAKMVKIIIMAAKVVKKLIV